MISALFLLSDERHYHDSDADSDMVGDWKWPERDTYFFKSRPPSRPRPDR